MALSLPPVSSDVPRSNKWLRRVLGVLLAAAAFYLLAIDQLSPHHLPGLKWIAFSVCAVGLMSVFHATRFRRVETAFCSLAVILGLVALGDIARVGTQHHASAHPGHTSSAALHASR